MNQEEIQKTLLDFERNRGQLLNISNQKQQMQFQNTTLKKAIEELDKTEEKKVYQAVGNIMILKDVKEVKKELREQKDSAELRVKTLQKQEDALIDKLNKLRSTIESFQAAAQAPKAEEEKEAKEEKKGK